jgi:hypothetical protein
MTIYYDEITRIIKKYGINNKDGFREDIMNLLGMSVPKPPIMRKSLPETHVAVTPYDYIPKGNYDAAMQFIRDHSDKGWFPVTDIPDSIFSDFMTIADMRKEIEFDAERDFQFIRIVNFSKSRGLCLTNCTK